MVFLLLISIVAPANFYWCVKNSMVWRDLTKTSSLYFLGLPMFMQLLTLSFLLLWGTSELIRGLALADWAIFLNFIPTFPFISIVFLSYTLLSRGIGCLSFNMWPGHAAWEAIILQTGGQNRI
jgi:hypothetical protein